MRVVAVVCFAITILGIKTAISNLMDSAKHPESFEEFVGYTVGLFLFPVLFLICGLILWRKSKKVS